MRKEQPDPLIAHIQGASDRIDRWDGSRERNIIKANVARFFGKPPRKLEPELYEWRVESRWWLPAQRSAYLIHVRTGACVQEVWLEPGSSELWSTNCQIEGAERRVAAQSERPAQFDRTGLQGPPGCDAATLEELEQAYKDAAIRLRQAEADVDSAARAWTGEWAKRLGIVGTVGRLIANGMLFYVEGIQTEISGGAPYVSSYHGRFLYSDGKWSESGRVRGHSVTFHPYDPEKDGPIPALPDGDEQGKAGD